MHSGFKKLQDDQSGDNASGLAVKKPQARGCALPSWLYPFCFLPEFLRQRG